MIENPNNQKSKKEFKQKLFDLEERTKEFAKRCRTFTKQLPKTIENREDAKQLIRSSGSVFANYLEANESLSKKDFFYRIRICRKEAKESRGWLEMIECNGTGNFETKRLKLMQEATELMKIFGSIASKGK